jgi:hypothetical protein
MFSFILLITSSQSVFAQNDKDIALVLKTIGKVSINRTGNSRWVKAQKGSRLNSGNVMHTGEKSLAAIVFTDDKSLLKVRSKSRITIKGKREKTGIKKTIFMRLGELWARVTKGSYYRVETPSGVAAVKGTEFYILFGEDGLMKIFCVDGLIDYLHRLGNIELKAGEVGESRPDAPPTKRPFKADELPQWANDSTDETIEVEFENEAGQKKKMNINIKRPKN